MQGGPELAGQDNQKAASEVKIDLARTAHREFDQSLKPLVGRVWQKGYEVACRKGCFSCCYEPGLITRQEAELLRERFLEMDEPDRVRILSEIRIWAERFRTTGLNAIATPSVFHYRAAKLKCPFLQNGECSVYEDRPLACRGHIAVGPEEDCHDDEKRKGQQFVQTMHLAARVLAKIARKDSTEADHLGVWMNRLLRGEKTESAALTKLGIQDA